MAITEKLIADVLTAHVSHYKEPYIIARELPVSVAAAQKIVSAYNRILRQEYDVIEARILTGMYSGRIIRGVCDYLNIPFRDEWQLAVNRHSKELMENYPKGKPDCKNKEIVDDKQTETVQAHLSIPQRLERIQNEICLNYCRFPLLVSEFNIMQEQYCSNCPLMDLL